MRYTTKDWSKAITRLIELTSNGTLSWDLTNNYDEDTFEVVDRAFTATNGGSRYVVKVTRRKNYIDEDEFFWVNSEKLEIYRLSAGIGREVLISTAPENPVTGRLLSSIEASFAFQQGALSGLLDD